MDAGRHLACRHAADRDKHENMNEKEDTDPLGIASLLFGCEANTPTETTPIIIPSGQVDRSQSVYSETLSSRYGTSLNAEIKHDLERISRQIVDTGDRILKDTRCCIADFRHDVEQRFRSLEFGVGRLKSTETDEDEGYNTIELLTDRTRLEEIQNACKQKEKDVMSYLETGAVGGTVCTGYEVNDSAPEWKIGMFTSINACWPGSCHDSHILRVSNVGRYLEAHHQDPERGYLLGDSGYPCRPFLLTPFLQPGNETEERYNRAHISTRNLVERTFGVWKRTFHVLHGEIRMKPQRVTRVIVACAVLHNLRLQWGEPEVEEAGDLDQPPADIFNGRMDGRGVRDHVARAYFQNQ